MEVLKSEFEEKLPVIEQAILEADFISIDTEFTGLTTPNIQLQNSDDLNARYHKLKHCVQEFTIIQYGVCAFKRTSTGDFEAKPFNFYIFGADTQDIQSRRIFSATPSSLSFLRSNKFDFNKLIEEGIPFYNLSEENSMFPSNQGKSMMTRHTKIQESKLTHGGRSFLDYNRKAIKKWLQTNTENPLVVQVNSGFYRRLIYQEIQESQYNGYLQANARDSSHIEITRLKEEERRHKKATAPKLNFRAVIELIQKAKCPVVAHNAVYDILHTVDQFWQYLPDTVEEFKEVTNSMWPHIVDTKYLAEYHPRLKSCFNTSVLGSLYNTVYEELQEAGQHVVMGEGFDRYEGAENETAHEAGYDAYMTGVIYLAFMAYIRENNKVSQPSEDVRTDKRKREDSDEVRLNTHKKFRQDDDDAEMDGTEQQEADTGKDQEEKEVVEGEEEEEEKQVTLEEDTLENKNASDEEDKNASDEEDKKTSDEEDKKTSDEEEESEEEEEGEIGSDSDSDESNDEQVKKNNSFFMDPSITPYYGRIFLMRSEIPYINLKGEETIEYVNYPNRFYLHNIPDGLTNGAIERLYPTIQPVGISWVNSNNAWLYLKDESKIPLVRLGFLGLSVVQSFLPGCSRQVEGEAYGITKEAGQMELLTHEQWRALYGPKPTINHNNHVSIQ
ncbi:ribonuclease H-like domain-containing protein [Blakeslea trispora]|nr:ribonuclease H-like domain-containing protein [Blakeslea trispora]